MSLQLELKWYPNGYFIHITQDYQTWRVRVPCATLNAAVQWFNQYVRRMQAEFEDVPFDLAPYEVAKEVQVEGAKIVLTHINGQLWIVEIQLEGDDNVYRTPIEADTETEANEKAKAIVGKMVAYMT